MRRMFSKPTILGAFTGGLLTTLVYIVFSSGLSLTWTAESETVVPKSEGASRTLKEVRSDILTQLHNNVFENPGRIHKFAAKSKVFLHKKRTVLKVITTSVATVKSTLDLINSSWGATDADWKVVVGSSNALPAEEVMLAQHCQDFSAADFLSAQQLFCLLKAVHNSTYFSRYQYFFIGTDLVYVAPERLERLLMKLDPGESMYIGKSKNSHCMAGPGFVLSHVAMKEVVTMCSFGDGLDDGPGDVALGACLKSKLHRTCQRALGKNSGDLFVEDFRGLSSKLNSTFRELYQGFISVFPVQSLLHMRVLQVLDQLTELEYYRQKISKAEENLYSSPICHVQPEEVAVMEEQVPQLSTATAEVWSWDVVNPNSSYISKCLEPREWYDGDLRLEMEMVSQEGLHLYNKRHNTSWRYVRLLYAHHRSLGNGGKEYLVDVEVAHESDGSGKHLERLHLFRPYAPQPIEVEDVGEEAINTTINFIVPLSNVKSRFMEFMKMYEELCLKVNERCKLNLVVYGDKDRADIESHLGMYLRNYSSAQFKIVPGSGKFSRGRALHTGIQSLRPSDLAFTCDVDMTISRSFLNRCRRNAIQGRRVYYPQVFKYYDMDYVYRFRTKPKAYDITREHGHWCSYGYGMQCIYKSDYDNLNGYESSIEGWGGEDILLVSETIENGYEIFRAPDPGLSHRYHPKVCSEKLSKDQYTQCLSSRNEDIADRRRLADNIYFLENKCNINKKVWD